MINDSISASHLKLRPNLLHIAVGSVFAVAILFTNFQVIRILDMTAFFAISFFNFLFVFLLFPLEGPLLRKTGLLIAGNIVGVFWHILMASFESTFLFLTTGTFKIIFLGLMPLTNFLWIVSMWSVSLSVLASHKTKTERLEKR